jgi:hypothetical protein
MNRRMLGAFVGTLVALAAGGWLYWNQRSQAAAEKAAAMREEWMDYIQDVLPGFDAGMREAVSALQAQDNPSTRNQLNGGCEALRSSWEKAEAFEKAYGRGFLPGLDEAVNWHQNAVQIADSWSRLAFRNRALVEQTLPGAETIRKNLAWSLESQEVNLEKSGILSPEEIRVSRENLEKLTVALKVPNIRPFSSYSGLSRKKPKARNEKPKTAP